MILATAITCLALNVYFESRGEPVTGQYAVAQVTWQRANHDSSKVCDVVTSPKQFSWTESKLKKHGKGKFALITGFTPKDKTAWMVAKSIAEQTINNKAPNYVPGATHYHALWVRPKWADSMSVAEVIGKHIFYKQQVKSLVTEGGVNEALRNNLGFAQSFLVSFLESFAVWSQFSASGIAG